MFHHVLFYPTVSIDPQKNELDVKKNDVSPGSLSWKFPGEFPKNPSAPRFGVFQGDSLNFLARGLHDVTLYGFDSFRGLPAAPGS
jgi:hypothetical protein